MMRMMNMHLHLIRIHCSMVRDTVLFNMVNPDLVLMPGRPCNEQGEYLPPHTPPPPPTGPTEAEPRNPWSPFDSRIEFDFAHYHFVEVQNSAGKINKALDLWAASVMEYGGAGSYPAAFEIVGWNAREEFNVLWGK